MAMGSFYIGRRFGEDDKTRCRLRRQTL